MCEFGKILSEGCAGTPRNADRVIAMLRPNCEAPHVHSCAVLGRIFTGLHGSGVESLRFLKLAAQQGDSMGCQELAIALDRGVSGTRDVDGALNWYRSSAEVGNPAGLNVMGALHWHGNLLPRDDVLAAMYFMISQSLGNDVAPRNLEKCMLKLSSAQAEQAEEMASAWSLRIKKSVEEQHEPAVNALEGLQKEMRVVAQ